MNAPWLIKKCSVWAPFIFSQYLLVSLSPGSLCLPSHSQSFHLPFTSELWTSWKPFLVLKIFKLSAQDRSHSYFSSTPLYRIKIYQTWGWKKGHELFIFTSGRRVLSYFWFFFQIIPPTPNQNPAWIIFGTYYIFFEVCLSSSWSFIPSSRIIYRFNLGRGHAHPNLDSSQFLFCFLCCRR